MRVKIADQQQITPGSLTRVHVRGVAVCLARTEDGALYGLLDACPHEGYSLSDGDLIGEAVECPMHSSQFDLRSGAVAGLPATEPAVPVKVVVDGDEIYVDVTEATTAPDGGVGRG